MGRTSKITTKPHCPKVSDCILRPNMLEQVEQLERKLKNLNDELAMWKRSADIHFEEKHRYKDALQNVFLAMKHQGDMDNADLIDRLYTLVKSTLKDSDS